MPRIVKPAVEIRQSNRALYLTAFTVDEFTSDFYRVDVLDPKDSSGFQRILEKRRSNRLASDMKRAREDAHAFLPTSVFLATEAAIEYDAGRCTISFDTKQTGRFNVVDGQHRIEGMLQAAKTTPSLAKFPLATVIAANLPELDQKLHFYLVNTTQKSVDKSIEQQIMARLKSKIDLGESIFLPDRIAREVRKGGDQIALDIVEYLNENPDSPWCGRIQMANEKSGEHTTIKQSAFVKSVKKYLLVNGHQLSLPGLREDLRNSMLKNYWSAAADIFAGDDAKKTVVFKQSGTVFFHAISMPMFDWLAISGNFRTERIKECFEKLFDHLPENDLELYKPDWWRRGGPASQLNSSAMEKRAWSMMVAINKARKAEQGEDAL